MADNVTTTTTVATLPATTIVATDQVTYSGDANAHIAPASIVHIVGSEGSKTAVSVSLVDDAAFTVGTSPVVPVAGTYRSSRDTLDANDAGAVAITASRAILACLETPNADSAMDDTLDAVKVSVVNVTNSSIYADDGTGFTPAVSNVSVIGGLADDVSSDAVDEGDVGAVRMTVSRQLCVTPQPHTVGGLSIFRSLDLDESEEEVKTTPGQVYAVWFTNTSTVTHWLKFYDGIASGVAVGTTSPVITIGLPGNSSDDISGSFSGIGSMGAAFSSGITVAVTTGVADNDTGAPTANAVILNVLYK